ncbi:MAG TPA: hypothetical protein DCW29_03525 [Janthinobacterium sp.]|nr:hypothetical protein [Janthinobacterium sp.]
MLSAIKRHLHRGIARSFQFIIAAEYKKAGLRPCRRTLSFGELSYLDKAGSDCAIVMLHGAGAEKESWVRFARYLGGTRRIIIPDLPGHGDSGHDMALDYDIGHQALRVAEFLASLQLRQVHLIANSMGCAIALRLAASHPELIASLILMSAAGVEARPGSMRADKEADARHAMMEVRSMEDYRYLMRIAMSKPPYIPAMFLKLLAQKKMQRVEMDRKIYHDILRDFDQRAILPQISMPTFIIWGAQDQVVHVDDADFLNAHIAGSRKLILLGIGHAPMVEAPRLLAAQCKDFLSRIGVDGPSAPTSAGRPVRPPS